MKLFTREPRIEAALLQRRDDVREWAVYADWLEANGSPRGALASLMLRREVTPTFALTEALKAHGALLSDLTPEPLKSLGTRGLPRLAPVFRRGFIHSAGAADATDFQMLVEHPSCALLDTVILKPDGMPALAAWLETVKAPLPWRRVEVQFNAQNQDVNLTALFERTPRLEHLTLALWQPPSSLELRGLGAESVTFHGATPLMLRALLPFKEQKLKRLEVCQGRNEYGERDEGQLDELVEALGSLFKRLDEVVLEGAIGEDTRRACLAGARPKRVVVRAPEPIADSFAISEEREETSFALFNRALTKDDEAAITQYAKLAGVTRLVVHTRVVDLGARQLSLLRLHGTGEAPLFARVVAQHLVKGDRTLDALALTLSQSNDITSTWAFGPHLARPETPKKTIPVARREEGRFTRHQVVREACEALLGFDAGLDVLEVLLSAFDFPEVRTLIGEPPSGAEQVPLFTDFVKDEPVEEEEEDEDEDGYYDDYEDMGGADRRDALAHQVGDDGPNDPRSWYDDDFEEFGSSQWGAAPENLPEYPRPEAPAPASEPVVIGASLKPTANAEDDDPEDDLDARTHDAWSADAEELWTEGPVDLPEHHRVPIGETFEEDENPGELPRGTYVPDAVPCAQCGLLRETERCELCRDEVCRECAGVKSLADWEERRAFHCAQCTPSSGKYVAVKARR
ncbi:MAG: hypothetical protein QM817_32005 [Archangium sp.]